MQSKNETVAEIVKYIRQVAHNAAIANKETKEHWRPAAFLATVADRIEAAHRREVAELIENIVRTSKRVDCQKVVIIDLRRRLKVAEDALAEIFNKVFVDCEVAEIANNTLAAIREKGGANA